MLIILPPAPAIMNHLVDGTPVREATEGAVVDEEIGVELAGADAVLVDFLAGIVAVDGEEFQATFLAEVNGFLQEPAFTGGPEDEGVAFHLQLFKGWDGEGEFLADVRIAMFDDGAVEVYCDDHLVVCWVGQYFYKVTSEGAGRYDDDAADVDHDALVACALDFYECTLKAVELASVDTYSCALGKVDFVRTEEEDAFGCGA